MESACSSSKTSYFVLLPPIILVLCFVSSAAKVASQSQSMNPNMSIQTPHVNTSPQCSSHTLFYISSYIEYSISLRVTLFRCLNLINGTASQSAPAPKRTLKSRCRPHRLITDFCLKIVVLRGFCHGQQALLPIFSAFMSRKRG